ncbi:hypothetical protein DFP72DRAFT_859641 [Ephemerocybe angulata]|uniref:Uncharacterized protein n=1 Tax=Ephemerocybe angulata TaxID=980116 RepID=A0A8H6LT95_9AGAR|nr:hypothetical protein DFP72DRAFT_859641 [Tulosesus angulatus]
MQLRRRKVVVIPTDGVPKITASTDVDLGALNLDGSTAKLLTAYENTLYPGSYESDSEYMDTDESEESDSSSCEFSTTTSSSCNSDRDEEDYRMSEESGELDSDVECASLGGTMTSNSFDPYEMLAELQYGMKLQRDAHLVRYITGCSLVQGFSAEEDEAVKTMLLSTTPSSPIDGDQFYPQLGPAYLRQDEQRMELGYAMDNVRAGANGSERQERKYSRPRVDRRN